MTEEVRNRFRDRSTSADDRRRAAELNALGETALDEGFYRLAELRFLEAFELDRDNPEYELNLGRAILRNPKRPAAIRQRMAHTHLAMATRRLPDSPVAHFALGQCLTESGDEASARRHLKRALSLRSGVFPEAERLLAAPGTPIGRSSGRLRLFAWFVA